jgi:hypothetical protein
LFDASGQMATIHVYRSQTIRKEHHRIFFDVFDPARGEFTRKCRAYVVETLKGDLHRHHCYQVRFNAEPQYPVIVEILNELPCNAALKRSSGSQ